MTIQSSEVVAIAPDPGYAPEFAVRVDGPLARRIQPLDDFPRAELRPHHHRHPRTALHAASERPPAAVKGGTMRFVGYPEIGRRVKLSQ